MVNSLYSSLTPSIRIILIGQITFITSDPYNITDTTCSGCSLGQVNSAELLATFNTWKKNAKDIPAHDTAHLFTGRTLEQGIVGKATVNGMCDATSNAGVEQITFMDGFNAVIAAHEIGHNLGMIHDGEGICASTTYGIMRPAIVDSRCGANAPQGSCQAIPASTWSQCSATAYQSFLKSTTATCLNNEPTKLWADTQICGNGFIEGNETCDCGARDCTHDPCCNGQTCQLRPNAVCSATDACCDTKCQIVPKNASLPCRAATSACDLVETCDGSSSKCGADLVRGAGTPCTMFASSEAGLCYLGSCIAPTTQCQLITYQISTSNQYHPCQRDRQLELTAGQICSTLYCSRINGPDNICYKFSSGNSSYFKVNDGTPCGESVTEALQCSKGECVASMNINPFQWNVSDWSACACASATQTRNVSCMSLTYEPVPSGACTGSQPVTSQYCDCYPSTSVATWKIIVYFISGIGAILLIYIIIRIIYKYRQRRVTQDPAIKPTQQEFSITHDLVNGGIHDKKQRPHSAIPSANSVRRESQISQEKGIKSHRDKNKRIHAPATETTLATSLIPMSLHPFTEENMNKKQDDIALDVQVSIAPAPMMNPNQRQQAIRPSAPMVARAASPPPPPAAAPTTSESLATAIYSGAIALQSTPAAGTSSMKRNKNKPTSTWQRNPEVSMGEDNELTPVATKQPIQRHPQSMRMQAASTSSPAPTSTNNSPARRMRTKHHGVMSDSASDDQHKLLTQCLPIQDDIASFSTSVAATHEPVIRSMSPDLEMEQDTPIVLPPTDTLITTTSSSNSITPPPSNHDAHHHVDIEDEDDLDRARARALHHHRTRSDRHGGKKKSNKKKKPHRHRRNQTDAY